MKRLLSLVLCVVFLGSAPIASANFLLWTGIGNGWKNQLAPIGTSGLENLGFGRSVNNVITLPGNFNVNSLTFVKDDQFEFTAAAPSILSLGAGGIDASYHFGTAIDFSSNLTVNLTAAQTWTGANGGRIILHGPLTGAGDLTFTGTGSSGLILANLTGTPSSYSGNLTIAATTRSEERR